MERLTKNDLIKIKILVVLKDSCDKLSVTALAQKLGVKYETIRNSISFLIACGLLKKLSEKHGRLIYEYLTLSDLGKKVAEAIDHNVLDQQ